MKMRMRKMMRRKVMRKQRKNIKRSREQGGNYTCVTSVYHMYCVQFTFSIQLLENYFVIYCYIFTFPLRVFK